MKKSESRSKTSNKQSSGYAGSSLQGVAASVRQPASGGRREGGRAKNDAGQLIVLSAPSGCGKTTIVERLLKRHPDWVRSISVTTREPRAGEKHGKDYFFVAPEAFRKMEANDELLESAKVFDQWYGTPKTFVVDHLKGGAHVILAIDVQGTKLVKKNLEKTDKSLASVSIFVLPPSVKVLRERLEGRKTESPAEIQKRIEVAQDEIKEAVLYDFTVVNQNLDHTVTEIEDFIQKFDKERR